MQNTETPLQSILYINHKYIGITDVNALNKILCSNFF